MTCKITLSDLVPYLKVARKVVGPGQDNPVLLKSEVGKFSVIVVRPGEYKFVYNFIDEKITTEGELIVPLAQFASVAGSLDGKVKFTFQKKQLKLESPGQKSVIPICGNLVVWSFQDTGMEEIGHIEGERFAKIINRLKKISSGGRSTWGCASVIGGYIIASDSSGLFGAKCDFIRTDAPLMIPVEALIPLTLLKDRISISLGNHLLKMVGENWEYVLTLPQISSPSYLDILDRYGQYETQEIDISILNKELQVLSKVCEGKPVSVSLQNKILHSSSDQICNRKVDMESSCNLVYQVDPVEYLKVGPSLSGIVSVAVCDGSHLYFSQGDYIGIVGCAYGSVKFELPGS